MSDLSPSSAVKRKRAIVDSQARVMAKRVLDMCVEERKNKCLTLPLNDAFGRASLYTGLSKRFLANIQAEAKRGPLRTPCRKRRPCNKYNNVNLDNLDRTAIIRTIEEFYITKGTIPTSPKLLAAIKEKVNFPWGTTTLRGVLKEIGYDWIPRRHCKGLILVEKPSVTLRRSKYLQTIRKYRQDDRNIFYFKICCTNDKNDPKATDTSSTSTIVIVHAGLGKAFLNESKLLFKTVSTSEDNSMSFEKWATDILIPNLPPNSIVVMENAPNYIIDENIMPVKHNSTKQVLLQWLAKNDVKTSNTMNKDELYDLIQSHKASEKKFNIDQCLSSYGHIIIELPPYTNDLNPIELAWVGLKSIGKPLNDIPDLSLKKLNETELGLMQITEEDWGAFDEQVIKLEEEYLEREVLIRDAINRVEAEAIDNEDSDVDSDKSASLESGDD